MNEQLSDIEELEIGRYENLRLEANRLAWAIDTQIERIRNTDISNDEYELQFVTDAEFLIISLHRLILLAKQVEKMSGTELRQVICQFEEALSGLSKVRNIIAHYDEYLIGSGHDSTVRPGSLLTHVNGETFRYGIYEIDLEKAKKVSANIYAAIKNKPPYSYLKAVKLYNSD